MGKLISFYRPAPKPPAEEVPEVPEKPISAGDILRELLEHSDKLEDVVVLLANKDRSTGFVSTLGDAGSTLLFMEQLKLTMVQATMPQDGGEGPKVS